MSEHRRAIFPVSGEQITTPAWLRGEGTQPVENLVDRLNSGAGAPAPAPPPEARADAPLPPPPRKPAERKEKPKPAQNRPPAAQQRAPKAGGIGALAPGARSIVPPAMDGNDARLEGGMNAFAEAVTELAIARASVLAAVEGDLLDLSLRIAEAIIEEVIQTDIAETAVHGEHRGDELPEPVATPQGRQRWLRAGRQRLEQRRAREARPIPPLTGLAVA